MPTTLQIDAYVDVICPWCWIGKRHLEKAIGLLLQNNVTTTLGVRWHPVQLLPDLPAQGVSFEAFYLNRLGSAAAVRARQDQVNAAAAQAGLHIDFSRIPVMPNTRLALQLLAYASEHGSTEQTTALMEQLFQAHFVQGQHIGDKATLLEIGQRCNLDKAAVQHVLNGTADKPMPSHLQPPMHAGVPYFVFNGQLALAGAQPAEVLLQAMRRTMAYPLQQEPA